ncbi:hypothetical protein SAMN05421507_108160 [Lentzea jiangxiensis]|uniref:Uncharacterized protein n=1 Tax=Lentzea jiangxiensis TaxID=641025 RepID=A0A1H0SN70_9PSEU|nr:hypothetical protein SAMN05421507_108160 [Lentzea jiangxiensis]
MWWEAWSCTANKAATPTPNVLRARVQTPQLYIDRGKPNVRGKHRGGVLTP